MGQCERVWDSMGPCGRVRESVGEYGRVWDSVGQCGRVWKNVGKCELSQTQPGQCPPTSPFKCCLTEKSLSHLFIYFFSWVPFRTDVGLNVLSYPRQFLCVALVVLILTL